MKRYLQMPFISMFSVCLSTTKKKTYFTKILYINYVDILQFQRYFIPQAELEEAFIYI